MHTKWIVTAGIVAAATLGAAGTAWAETMKLHIGASGVSVNPPDRLRIVLPVLSKGETSLAARLANKKRQDEITAKLVSGGIDRTMIKVVRSQGQMGYVGTEPFDENDMTIPGKTALSILQIVYGDPALTARIRRLLEESGEEFEGSPFLTLLDNSKAKKTAIADSLVNARKEADAYAAALGMKVARMTAVSNVEEPRANTFDAERTIQEINDCEPNEANVTTRAYSAVDFELTTP